MSIKKTKIAMPQFDLPAGGAASAAPVTKTEPQRLMLIDGSALAYRSYFAFISNPLINSRGENTSAVFGFTNSLLRLRKQEKFDYWVIVFDCKQPTFRHRLYEQYKATRQKMPDEMKDQLPRIQQVVETLAVPRLEMPGYEADDVIGTLAVQAVMAGVDVVIYSSDKDFMQLVRPGVSLLNPRKDADENGIVDRIKVKEKFGVEPEQVVDVLGLMGDASDNVPGVPGVGEKTAMALIQEFGSIDNLLAKLDTLKKVKLREKIEANRELLDLSRRLVTIDTQVPLEQDFKAFAVQPYDADKVTALFQELEFTRLIKDVAGPAPATASVTIFRTVDTPAAWQTLLAALKKKKDIVLDIETTGLDPLRAAIVGLSFCMEPHEAFYVPLGHTVETSRNLPAETVLAELKEFLEGPDCRVSGQNIKYDYLVLASHNIVIRNVVFDTMVASYLINPSKRQHNLDALSLEHLHHRMTSYDELVQGETKKEKKSFDQVPVDLAAAYSGDDAAVTCRLEELFRPQLASAELMGLFNDVEMPLVTVLARVERNGVALDRDFLQQMSQRIEGELARLTVEIHRLAGEEFNINSTQQLGVILFDKMKLPKKRKTKTGYSTDSEVLDALAPDYELPRRILEYRELAKLKSTYVDALLELCNPATGRVHTSFNQTVTTTGRLSSSDPNLQNIPIRTELGREIRKAFVASTPDAVILAADYSQIELRLMAHLSQDAALVEAFKQDADIHARTASLVFNIFPEMVSAEMRRQAKAINFGIMYGMGQYGLSKQLNIPVPEAGLFIQNYFNQYPGVHAYIEKTIAQAREQGYVTTMLGRRRYLPELASSNRQIAEFAERTAVNTPIQGTAADLIKKAMIEIDRELTDKKLATKMILQVHDELVFEVPGDELDVVEKMVRQRMEHALELIVPIKVDMKYGKNWFEAH